MDREEMNRSKMMEEEENERERQMLKMQEELLRSLTPMEQNDQRESAKKLKIGDSIKGVNSNKKEAKQNELSPLKS